MYDEACLSTEVSAIDWDPARSRWVIRTNRDDEMTARFLVMGNGPLHRPKLPGIPGIKDFRGHTFHTSRWDYGYTGGTSRGGLDQLHDKRVGIIGTGATAVQVVPHLAAAAAQLCVFQRTPSSIDVRANRPTDPEWAASLESGWQQKRIENFTILTSGGIADEDLVMDGWTDIIGRMMTWARGQDGKPPADLAATLEMVDFEKMEQMCMTDFCCVCFCQCFSPINLHIYNSLLVAIISFGLTFALKDFKVIGTRAVGEMDILKPGFFLQSATSEAIFDQVQRNVKIRIIGSGQNVGG